MKQKVTLLKVGDVKKLTGWHGREDFRRARQLGWIKMERVDGKIYYIKETLNPEFIKPQTA